RHVHADTGIGGPRSARDEGNAGTSGAGAVRCAIGTCHESRAAFLAAGHGLDRLAIAQGVEHRQEALSRHGKHAIAPLFLKAIDEHPGGLVSHATTDSAARVVRQLFPTEWGDVPTVDRAMRPLANG